MSRFQKRQTVRTLEILDNTFEVDFGKDEIPLIFQEVAEESKNIGGEKGEHAAILDKQKAVFKTAINNIIGNTEAADQIFKEDNSAILHSDVYTFLVNQYTEVMTEESPYSPKRLNQ